MASAMSRDDLSGIMERMAIGSSGRVGSLYDGYKDCVLEQLEVNIEQNPPAKKPTSCELIHWNTDTSQNILQTIGIEADLRINILLKPTLRTALAALIDHPHSLDKHTRLLYYTYVDRFDQLDTTTELPKLSVSVNANNTATHIITDVSWGINVVVILQLLPESKRVTAIDEILEKLRAFLGGDQEDAIFSSADEELFEKNVKTQVYSNIADLRNMTSVFTVCQHINGCSQQFSLYRPMKYILWPIKFLYPQYSESEVKFFPLPPSTINNLEQHLIQLLNTIKELKHALDCSINDLLPGYLKQRVHEIQEEWASLNNAYKQEMKRIQKLITDIRSKRNDTSEIDKVLKTHTPTALTNCIETFTRNIDELKSKKQFIISLHEQHFEYCNVAEFNVNKENYEQILLQNLATNPIETWILCSDDTLNKKKRSNLTSLRDSLMQESGINQNLHLIYADFSDCPGILPDMMILPSNKNGDNVSTQEQCASASTKEDIINILLLGESGVGKSTFINAFVNYLLFETLKNAESNKPVVLIPVSFQMTTGDNFFEERVINFGGFDNFNNENFDHPGQSVTQQCKSYLFTLKHTNGRKLRIIDTPGFGDRRGIDQDDMNMQHILKYVNNMTHLNAICFLLKPNAAQLNNYFPICLTQLLDLLGPDARQNIIFCFTNARTSFYSPGETVRLLKTMLKSMSMVDIPFKKENTFCFDNESFCYLVALKNGIDFPDDGQKHEYEMSWSTSFKESDRLVSYVNKQFKAYSLHHNLQSNKHAQIKIMEMIRPMLEATRNIFRHIILDDMNISNKSIKLKPATIYRPASRCNACERIPVRFDDFFIAIDDPHEIQKHCYLCSCSPSQHSSIDYVLQYELLDSSPEYDRNRMNDIIRQLRVASNNFAYFLIHIVRSTKHDPFAIGLANIIKEENDLCRIRSSKNLNAKLVEYLKNLQETYEHNKNEMNSNKKHIELSAIYEWIEKVCTLPEVREQMVAVQQSQANLMAEYEYVVSEDLIK